MHSRISAIILFVFCCHFVIAQQNFIPNIYIEQFNDEKKGYVELYVGIPAKSVQYIQESENSVKASVECIVLVKSGTSIIHADKFTLISPNSTEKKDFWDLKRYALQDGTYSISVEAYDTFDEQNKCIVEEEIIIRNDLMEPVFSDIILCSELSTSKKLPFQKYSFSYERLPFNLAGNEISDLHFFVEAYHLEELNQPKLVLKSSIIKGFVDADSTEMIIEGYQKISPSSKEVIVKAIDIESLNSGDYHLSVELISPSKKVLLNKKCNFQIYHPESDLINLAYANEYFEHSFVQDLTTEELDFTLKAISPQIPSVSQNILTNIIGDGSILAKRYFIFNYFTGQSREHADVYYAKYMEVAHAVDNMYRDNVGFGFESDRGYMFMKYGKPDQKIEVIDEPSAPPYEIWFYNTIANQTNVKFLFHNPSLSGNNFFLLHSTCLGEKNNPNWEVELYGDAPNDAEGNRIDSRTVISNNNRNARRYFSDL